MLFCALSSGVIPGDVLRTICGPSDLRHIDGKHSICSECALPPVLFLETEFDLAVFFEGCCGSDFRSYLVVLMAQS